MHKKSVQFRRSFVATKSIRLVALFQLTHISFNFLVLSSEFFSFIFSSLFISPCPFLSLWDFTINSPTVHFFFKWPDSLLHPHSFPFCRMNSSQLSLFPPLPFCTVIMLLIERGPSVCVHVCARLLSCRESEESIDPEIWGSLSKKITTTYSPDTHAFSHTAAFTHTSIRRNIKHAHFRSGETIHNPHITGKTLHFR